MGDSCSELMGAPALCRILVVEDEVLIRLMIADILMRAGFQVVQAASADEGLQVLHSSVEVSLVLTDIRMPGSANGLELARRIRADWPALKIVIVSSEDMEKAADLPADAFIGKPFHPTDVVGTVKQLLGLQNDQP